MADNDKREITEIANQETLKGENINAKKVGNYGYDPDAGVWRRMRVNSAGEAISIATFSDTSRAANYDIDGTTWYFGEIDGATWTITRVNSTTGVIDQATGDSDYADNWDGRADLTYS